MLLSIVLDAKPYKHRLRHEPYYTSSDTVLSSSVYINCHIRSMSSQSTTMPCSIGYLIFKRPRNSCALFPMKTSPSMAPAMILRCFGRPTLQTLFHARRPKFGALLRGKKAFGLVLAGKAGLYHSGSLNPINTGQILAYGLTGTLSMQIGWLVNLEAVKYTSRVYWRDVHVVKVHFPPILADIHR